MPGRNIDDGAGPGLSWIMAIPSDLRSTIETRLLELWREVLGSETITLDDDVLQLGATSLQMMSVIGRIATQLGTDVPLEAFFDAITIGDQATVLGCQD